MKKSITQDYIIKNDFELDVDFHILDGRVYTEIDKIGRKVLIIRIEVLIEDFETLGDGPVLARPRLLIILGILTLLTQIPFSVSSIFGGGPEMRTLEPSGNTKFYFNGSNLISYISTIELFLKTSSESSKKLFFSVIDRYRKAIYLVENYSESMIFNDEILLSFFHILELLTEHYYPQQKKIAAENIRLFSKSLLKETHFLSGANLQEEEIVKTRMMEKLLLSELSISSKILFMFQEQGIYSDRLKYFLSELVNDRNSVAHGKEVYRDIVVFPMPAFFPLIKDAKYSFKMLQMLCGRVISIFLKLSHLEKEWNEFHTYLHPTIGEVNDFINEKRYENLTSSDFLSGKDNQITPFLIQSYLMENDLKLKKVIPVLSPIILDYKSYKGEVLNLLFAVCLILDVSKDNLHKNCIEIITFSQQNDGILIKPRDVLYHLEYLGHKPLKLREMLLNGHIKRN
jgi:hypothetical protein